MKVMMNFTTSPDDTNRYADETDLFQFYRHFGCDGLELMPIEGFTEFPIHPDKIIGIHARCLSDWMYLDRNLLLDHYRKDLEYARAVQAEYVVFHVTQVSYEECLTYRLLHTDMAVAKAAADFINALLDGQNYQFWFLMENLWWPGLNFLDPAVTRCLTEEVHYEKKGLMLDTGHFMNTKPALRTEQEAIHYLNHMLDRHADLIPMIRGLHLNKSLSGPYVEQYRKNPAAPPDDPALLFCRAFEHIFKIDQHLPLTAPSVPELIHRISPQYVTLEYITDSRQMLASFLRKGTDALLKADQSGI